MFSSLVKASDVEGSSPTTLLHVTSRCLSRAVCQADEVDLKCHCEGKLDYVAEVVVWYFAVN